MVTVPIYTCKHVRNLRAGDVQVYRSPQDDGITEPGNYDSPITWKSWRQFTHVRRVSAGVADSLERQGTAINYVTGGGPGVHVQFDELNRLEGYPSTTCQAIWNGDDLIIVQGQFVIPEFTLG